MSVLIMGMKMPTSCLKGGCPLDGFACQLWEDKYWASYEDPEKGRHRDCPLIELPDHGDLIDQKVIMREFSDFVRASNNSDFAKTPTWNDAVSLVGSAYVVIPAERSEE